jgi:hypothetical protein
LRVSECGKALAIAGTQAMATRGSVHLPTLVAGCARMSGSYLLRSFSLNLHGMAPGQVVLSAQAAEKTQMLIRYCAAALHAFGSSIPAEPGSALEDPAARLRLDFAQTQRLLEPVFAALKDQHALGDEEMAKACAVATGALIHQFAKHVEPSVGFGLAAYGFTEGARTVPWRGSPDAA